MIKNWFIDTADIPSKNFNPERGVSSRLAALDLARCLAMFFMVMGHVIYEITDSSFINPDNNYYQIWSFIRGLTAPIFLTVSGAVQVFANKRDETGRIKPKHITRRITTSLMLIGIGYLLVFPAQKLFHLIFISPNEWLRFFQVHILQVIGISIVLLLVVFIFTRKDRTFALITFLIGVMFFISSPIIHSVEIYNYFPAMIAPYFSFEKGSLFTLFPYTGFMFLGASFGALIKMKAPEKRLSFIKKFGIITGTVLVLISLSLFELEGRTLLSTENFYSSFGLPILRQGLVFIFITVVVLLYEKTKKLSGWYSLFGKRALFVYVIHLIILYGTPWSISFGQLLHRSLSLYISIPIALFVVILSACLAWLYDYTIRKSNNSVLLFRYSILFFIVFLLLI